MSFIYEFFALPSFPFSHPTVNMEIVFVSWCVHTHISIHGPLCRDLLMSFFYTVVNANLCCSCSDAMGAEGVMWLLLLHPPSINTLPHLVAVLTVNHLCLHTLSMVSLSPSPSLSVCLSLSLSLSLILLVQPAFYCHYYIELPLSL